MDYITNSMIWVCPENGRIQPSKLNCVVLNIMFNQWIKAYLVVSTGQCIKWYNHWIKLFNQWINMKNHMKLCVNVRIYMWW